MTTYFKNKDAFMRYVVEYPSSIPNFEELGVSIDYKEYACMLWRENRGKYLSNLEFLVSKGAKPDLEKIAENIDFETLIDHIRVFSKLKAKLDYDTISTCAIEEYPQKFAQNVDILQEKSKNTFDLIRFRYEYEDVTVRNIGNFFKAGLHPAVRNIFPYDIWKASISRDGFRDILRSLLDNEYLDLCKILLNGVHKGNCIEELGNSWVREGDVCWLEEKHCSRDLVEIALMDMECFGPNEYNIHALANYTVVENPHELMDLINKYNLQAHLEDDSGGYYKIILESETEKTVGYELDALLAGIYRLMGVKYSGTRPIPSLDSNNIDAPQLKDNPEYLGFYIKAGLCHEDFLKNCKKYQIAAILPYLIEKGEDIDLQLLEGQLCIYSPWAIGRYIKNIAMALPENKLAKIISIVSS